MHKLLQNYLPKNVIWHPQKRSANTLKTTNASTAGIIVIGDEILNGEVVDTNSSYMTSRLHKFGVGVRKISIIGDSLNDISEEVQKFSSRYKYVITSGGIGPTHDDVTFEAVGKAFNEPLILHPELVKICKGFYNTEDPSSPGMKLARVPVSAKLTFLEKGHVKLNYPNVSVRNVYMFPGIPQLFQRSFDLLGSLLFQSTSKFYTKYIYFNVTEDQIAQTLDLLVKEFPAVLVGSYPEIQNSDYKVKITIKSMEEKLTLEAYKKLLAIVPKNMIVKL